MRLGVGQAMGPAAKPGGSCQVTATASPGVAGIAPVDVPVLLDAQADADPEGLARGDRGRLGDQLGLHQLAHRRRGAAPALASPQDEQS